MFVNNHVGHCLWCKKEFRLNTFLAEMITMNTPSYEHVIHQQASLLLLVFYLHNM